MKQIIAITGGIACGKTTISDIILGLGYKIISCDKISYQLTLKGNSIYNEILREFGLEYLDESKEIDRKKLGNLIFNDNNMKIKLNKITHPLIIDELKRQINDINDEIIFVEVPLLFESNLEYLFDKIICIYVSRDTQINRLMKRDSIDYEYAIKKIDSQLDLNIKMNKSDYLINNEISLSELKNSIIKIINNIKGDN